MGVDFTFDPERHLYLVDGRPVPSVTQVLHSARLAADYSMVPPDVLERKRIIGQLRRVVKYMPVARQMWGKHVASKIRLPRQ